VNPYINAIQRALATGHVEAARQLHDTFASMASTKADRWWVHHLGNCIQRELFKHAN